MSYNELYHYGVVGMKWGVRRYQNYDGSYTKKGLERYNKARATYDEKKSEYKKVKAAYKAGTANRSQVRNAKSNAKIAEKDLKKHYKHLKQDKLGDEGKRLYAEGKRITFNQNTRNAVAMGTSIATYLLYNRGDKEAAMLVAGGGAILEAGMYIVDEYQDRRLRAFYGHTSNY